MPSIEELLMPLVIGIDLAPDQIVGLALMGGSVLWLGIHWVRHGWFIGGDS